MGTYKLYEQMTLASLSMPNRVKLYPREYLEAEYQLIQKKESDLSANERKMIVSRYEEILEQEKKEKGKKDGQTEEIFLEKLSTGMTYEIEAFRERAILNQSESCAITEKEETALNVMKVMDTIREKIGLVYPLEEKAD